nr:MAG TPA: hypothetical protein [Caudoviricetes sp.]
MNKTIEVKGSALERFGGEREVCYGQIIPQVFVSNEDEAKRLLSQSIKKALELDAEAVNLRYGLRVMLSDSSLRYYTMVARATTDDPEIEELMAREFPEQQETLDNGIEIRYGKGDYPFLIV